MDQETEAVLLEEVKVMPLVKFIPSNKFKGYKEKYIYTRRGEELGYHLDVKSSGDKSYYYNKEGFKVYIN